MSVDDLDPGYYKVRLYQKGPWVPVRVWLEGERDEAGDLVEDERLRCQWWPCMDDPFTVYEIDPFEEVGIWIRHYFFQPIDKDEFEWMLLLKAM